MDIYTVIIVFGAIGGIIAGGVVHEFGHAWAALKLGDDTAAKEGRLSLHPSTHIDPFGTIILPIILFVAAGFVFGGMRPVPFDPSRMRHPDRDIMLVAAAGPGFQFLFVFVVWALFLLMSPLIVPLSFAYMFFYWAILANVLIALFNLLLPIPPLDASKILRYFLPPHLRAQYDSIGPMIGFALILLLVFSGALRAFLGPFLVWTNVAFRWSYENLALVNWTGLVWS